MTLNVYFLESKMKFVQHWANHTKYYELIMNVTEGFPGPFNFMLDCGEVPVEQLSSGK